jgi:hypothetical protein
MPGSTCIGGGGTQCARYCCTDADCGGGAGTCLDLSSNFGTTVKVCGSAN